VVFLSIYLNQQYGGRPTDFGTPPFEGFQVDNLWDWALSARDWRGGFRSCGTRYSARIWVQLAFECHLDRHRRSCIGLCIFLGTVRQRTRSSIAGSWEIGKSCSSFPSPHVLSSLGLVLYAAPRSCQFFSPDALWVCSDWLGSSYFAGSL